MPALDRVPGMNPNVPTSARIWDYMLGGKDNYEVDREVAHRILAIAPDTRPLAWFIRRFLVTAVQQAAKAGIDQFIDLGTGIPTSPTVHEIARKINPSANVVYIDNDPVVRAHCEALLADTAPGLTAIEADIRRPQEIIDRLRTGALIDFSEPVAVLALGVLHHVMDEENPYQILATLRDALAPGSLFAFTHASDETHPEIISRTHEDTNNSPAQCRFRRPAEIEKFLDGFDIRGPGVVPVQQWLDGDLPLTHMVVFGGIGVKPAD